MRVSYIMKSFHFSIGPDHLLPKLSLNKLKLSKPLKSLYSLYTLLDQSDAFLMFCNFRNSHKKMRVFDILVRKSEILAFCENFPLFDNNHKKWQRICCFTLTKCKIIVNPGLSYFVRFTLACAHLLAKDLFKSG